MAYPELAQYIAYSRKNGLSDRQILSALVGAGWMPIVMEQLLGLSASKPVVLAARNVFKSYEHDTAVLHGVSLAITQGESVALIGKSGSGKSTLMHILATLDRPTSGEIMIDGTATSMLSSAQIDTLRNKKFGFVFQQFFVNGRDTCLENVTLPLTIMGVSKSERQRKGMDMLAAVGLAEKAEQPAGTLSGGQKQRLCIGRALITEPELIFADEPTGNLDSENSANVMSMLISLQRERGITLVLVTHDPDLANLCDRTITLKDGNIIP